MRILLRISKGLPQISVNPVSGRFDSWDLIDRCRLLPVWRPTARNPEWVIVRGALNIENVRYHGLTPDVGLDGAGWITRISWDVLC